jgi:hypothetical protein
LFVFAWFTFAGGTLGWVESLLAFGLLGAASGWVAVAGRWKVARRNTAIGLAALLGLAGIAVAHWAPATEERLRHSIKQLADPRWHLVTETVTGNALCFDYCTSVTRHYRVSVAPADLFEELRPVLARHGLRPTRAFDRGSFGFADRRGGDIDRSVSIAPGTSGATVSIEAAASG